MKVFSRKWPTCGACGGSVMPTHYGALTPGVAIKVVLGSIEYGGAEPPVVSCGGCGAELDL